MADPAAPSTSASDLLRAEIEELERKLARKKHIYTQLREDEHEDSTGISVSPTEFSQMEKVDAVVKYLMRLNRPAHLYNEILPALERGGCELGKDKDRHPRNLKIAVRMNSKHSGHQLSYDEKTEMVSLRQKAKAGRIA